MSWDWVSAGMGQCTLCSEIKGGTYLANKEQGLICLSCVVIIHNKIATDYPKL